MNGSGCQSRSKLRAQKLGTVATGIIRVSQACTGPTGRITKSEDADCEVRRDASLDDVCQTLPRGREGGGGNSAICSTNFHKP